jgi:hypothetical protein
LVVGESRANQEYRAERSTKKKSIGANDDSIIGLDRTTEFSASMVVDGAS